jgi:hypothetical protein
MRKDVDLDAVFCVKTIRVLRNDFTIAYNSRLYQIEDNVNAEKVTVEERANGERRSFSRCSLKTIKYDISILA